MLKLNKCISVYSKRFNHLDAIKNSLVEKFSKLNTRNHYDYLVSKNPKIGKFHRASILVPISVDAAGRTYFTLMQRTASSRHYSSQMCFMGGMADERADGNDPVATAFREAHEESGLDRARCVVLAKLCPLVVTNIGRDSFVLTPVIVYLDKRGLKLELNKSEVERLVDVETVRFLSNVDYEPNPISIGNDEFYFHYFEKIKIESGEEISVWGITAMIATMVSSFWHSKPPEFAVDPQLPFNPNDPNQFLYDFALVRLPNVIDLLLNQK